MGERQAAESRHRPSRGRHSPPALPAPVSYRERPAARRVSVELSGVALGMKRFASMSKKKKKKKKKKKTIF
eukprot:NODE_25702_length_578_cov_1.552106.p3 GENE.NODE_25702_length_578_cov_1.552106~~NODE_25702_length_578_cov_1.552106.p3  ORF type:complete len:71 (-),score=27.27 NODE_25702_length_578_cov_1.552106:74-286(-)